MKRKFKFFSECLQQVAIRNLRSTTALEKVVHLPHIDRFRIQSFNEDCSTERTKSSKKK